MDQKQYDPSQHFGYMFNRKRTEGIGELPETVLTLRWPFPIPPCPEGENPKKWEEVYRGAEVYIVGTSHFSKKSPEDVKKVIEQVQPDVVMVELCPSRAQELFSHDEVTYGAEFLMAYKTANQIKCQFVLGDLDHNVTDERIFNTVSWWELAKCFVYILSFGMVSYMKFEWGGGKDELEKPKNMEFYKQQFEERASLFPKITEILVTERDKYLTNSLQELLINHTVRKREAWQQMDGVKWQPLKIVGVVGIGHYPGIVAHWGEQIDVSELSRIPEPPLSKKLAKKPEIWTLCGLAAYTAFTMRGSILRR